MTLPASGPISLLDIQNEFGGTAPISLDEYYRSSTYVPNILSNTTISASNGIALNQFRSTKQANPSYALTRSASEVTEPGTITITLNTTDVVISPATPVAYTITGISTADINGESLTGSFSIGESQTDSKTFSVVNDGTVEATETFTLTLNNGAAAISVSIKDAVSYAISPNYTLINEGASQTYTITMTGVASGTALTWTILDSDGVSQATDFAANQGTIYASNAGNNYTSASFTVTANANVTDGLKKFSVVIKRDGATVATATELAVQNGTSYSFSFYTNNTYEGEAKTFSVSTSGVPDGTTLYWYITFFGNTTLSDFTPRSGSFTINANAGSFSITPYLDGEAESGDTYRVEIRTGSINGTTVATTGLLTIYDTKIQLWAWGNEFGGDLANNRDTQQRRSNPVQEASGSTNWLQVSRTAAIKMNGTLWAWGYNGAGEVGDGTRTHRSSPVPEITGSTNWKQVSSGIEHTAAIKTDGTLWCWGGGYYGELGIGVFGLTSRSSPVQEITYSTNWSQVAGGARIVAAIKTDGTLWCWGSNSYGQLGDGTNVTLRTIPTQEITYSTNWKQVDAFSHVAAIKTDGTLWAWGRNFFGQLGDNYRTDRSIPTQEITGSTNWSQVSTGNHTAAIKTDGTLWAWGANYYGQLGDGTVVSKLSPVQEFTGATTWKYVSVWYAGSAALRSNSTLWTWGSGAYGELGNGTGTEVNIPTIVSAGTNASWASVSTGNNRKWAIKLQK